MDYKRGKNEETTTHQKHKQLIYKQIKQKRDSYN